MKGECGRKRTYFEGLCKGNRRGEIRRAYSEIAERLIKELGMSLTGVARLLDVSTSTISKMLQRRAEEKG